ncbi:ras-related protein Rab-28-like [Arctopsyche grandis]|uniref:ras-related protein Rab-28-like n=1 Tax=Arctopsyche grandis TaxID=121162 RepID=UPI00406D718D
MSDSEEDAALERQVKISLVGEPSTGKSMLCTRYLGLQWAGTGVPTQGAEMLLGECSVRPTHPPVPIKLCDIAGNACNTSMLINYLYASDIIILTYDVTNLQSFESLRVWLNNIKNIFAESDAQPVLAMFGNKCDLEHQRAVRLGCAQAFAEENNLISFTGSARTGENVNSLMIILVSQVLGIPVNRSLLNNTVIKAELAPHKKNYNLERNKSIHPNVPLQTTNTTDKNRKDSDNSRDAPEKKESVRKSNKKALKELRKKASSTVCSVQ